MRRFLQVAALSWVALLGAAIPARADSLPPIRHVFVIVIENKSFDQTFGFGSASPYLSLTLPSMGALLPNYYGVTHESMGNYVALVSGQGSNPQTQTDCQVYSPLLPGTIGADDQAMGQGCVYPSAVKTIADQLDAAKLSWKGYMEDMGNAAGEAKTCAHPALLTRDSTQSARAGDQYAARHNPFVYFQSLLSSGACARDDVPLSQLPSDLRTAATTPDYSLIVPNLCDDGHDPSCVDGRVGGLPAVDAFLRAWVPQILASPAYRQDGLLAIVSDEAVDQLEWAQHHPAGAPPGGDGSSCCNEPQFPNTSSNGGLNSGGGGGRTGAVLLSPFIDPGTLDNVAYNHFSMLRSSEDLFRLGHLGYAAMPGLRALGSDAFTCYRSSVPRPRRHKLARGSEIKLAILGQGTARRPMVEVKLWFAGRVKVQAVRHRRVRVRGKGHHRRTRIRRRLVRVGRPQNVAACQLLKVRLPRRHDKVIVSARAFGGIERRTITY